MTRSSEDNRERGPCGPCCPNISYLSVAGFLTAWTLIGGFVTTAFSTAALVFAVTSGAGASTIVAFGVQMGIGIIYIVFPTVLIYGLHRRDLIVVKLWVVSMVVFLLITILLVGTVVIIRLSAGKVGDFPWPAFLLGLVFEVYYIWVVRGYALIMENEDECNPTGVAYSDKV